MSDDDGLFGIDWDGDGHVDGLDDYITYHALTDGGGGGSSKGCCGTCLLYVALIPVGVIGLIRVVDMMV